MEAGFGNQTGRWTSKKAGPVMYEERAVHRKWIGDLGRFGEQDDQRSRWCRKICGAAQGHIHIKLALSLEVSWARDKFL